MVHVASGSEFAASEEEETTEEIEMLPKSAAKRKNIAASGNESEEMDKEDSLPAKHKSNSSGKKKSNAANSSDDKGILEDPAPRPKRKLKSSEKQAAMVMPSSPATFLDTELLEAKKRKLDKLQKEIQQLDQPKKKSPAATKENNCPDVRNREIDVESEEETEFPHRQISSSIQVMSITTNTSGTSTSARPPLKRIGAAAARMPSSVPKLSSNTFKTLPTPVNQAVRPDVTPGSTQGFKLKNVSNTPSDSQVSSDPSTGISSPCVTHVNTTDGTRHKSTTATSDPSLPAPVESPASTAPADARQITVSNMWRAGAEINPKKPKASDYVDVVHALILQAASEYEAYISTKDAFPDTPTQNKWARLSWKNAGLAASEDYPFLDSISLLLRSRGSRIRGCVITSIRPILLSHLGFKRGGSAQVITENIALYKSLKTDAAFHYKDPEALTGFCQGKIISEILSAVWFEDIRLPSVIFKELFNPIPLETLALILTVTDFALDKWSSGTCIKATLWEKDIVECHCVFWLDLEEWHKLNPKVVIGHWTKLYLRAERNAGVSTAVAVKQNLVGEALNRARQELEGRTGETDSEAEE